MTEYRNSDWEQNFYPLPQEPKKRKKKNQLAKKITSIVLSGMLFGSVAGGVFTGVVHTTGAASTASTQTQTTKETSVDPVTLQTATATSNGTVDSQSLDVSDIVETAMPSIVAITNKSVQEVQSYFSMFGRSSGTQQQEVESQGSGIIIGQNDEELLIVTNNHVIEDAQTISACFIDDRAYEAVVKGTDADNDL
ncbi:MAG: serine protease HtrA, partial [Ruminococcus sp.]|nr:serine protease HtrA [Ruminococcus sp.]